MEIVINDQKINYIERKHESSEKTVLLLHGWGTSIESFNPLIEEYSKKYNVYAIDFPGFGKSPKPPVTYTVEDYSKIVLKFIEELHLEHVTLLGHSFGGRVIIKLCGKLGYEPEKIILADSAGVKPKLSAKTKIKIGVYKVIKKTSKFILGKKLSEKIIGKARNKVGSADYVNADEDMKIVFKNVINEDLVEYMKNIKAPTLLMWGDRDLDTPLSDAKIMEKEFQNAGLVIIQGAGHYSFLNNTPYFVLVTNNFIEGE